MGTDNLISLSDRTTEEQRGIATAGGKASGEARRRKKAMREWAEIIGAIKTNVSRPDGSLMEDADLDADVVMAQYRKAHKGDTKAAQWLANLKGEEQPQQISQTTIVVASEDEAEKLRNIKDLG